MQSEMCISYSMQTGSNGELPFTLRRETDGTFRVDTSSHNLVQPNMVVKAMSYADAKIDMVRVVTGNTLRPNTMVYFDYLLPNLISQPTASATAARAAAVTATARIRQMASAIMPRIQDRHPDPPASRSASLPIPAAHATAARAPAVTATARIGQMASATMPRIQDQHPDPPASRSASLPIPAAHATVPPTSGTKKAMRVLVWVFLAWATWDVSTPCETHAQIFFSTMSECENDQVCARPLSDVPSGTRFEAADLPAGVKLNERTGLLTGPASMDASITVTAVLPPPAWCRFTRRIAAQFTKRVTQSVSVQRVQGQVHNRTIQDRVLDGIGGFMSAGFVSLIMYLLE
jgi:hypothetical protein